MAQRRLYTGSTTPFAFRMSAESRALLEWLAASEGTSPGHYMREVWEKHLRDAGFRLEPGAEAVADPLHGTPEGWVRDRTTVEPMETTT